MNLDWPIHKLDIKNALLSEDFEDEVYMSTSRKFETTDNKYKIFKLETFYMTKSNLQELDSGYSLL